MRNALCACSTLSCRGGLHFIDVAYGLPRAWRGRNNIRAGAYAIAWYEIGVRCLYEHD